MNNDLMFSSADNEWTTPDKEYAEWDAEFHYTLDPCCTKETAKTRKFFTEKENGLLQSWAGEEVFMNPPYATPEKTCKKNCKKKKCVERGYHIHYDIPGQSDWVRKAYIESLFCRVSALIPARTDTKNLWHKYVWDNRTHTPLVGVQIRFIEGRLTFGNELYWNWLWEQKTIHGKKNKLYHQYGKKNPAPFPSVLVVFDRRKRGKLVREMFDDVKSFHAYLETLQYRVSLGRCGCVV